MENSLDVVEIKYKDIEEYKAEIDIVIQNMLIKKERMTFAVVAESAGVDRMVIRRHWELRDYILERMAYFKELHSINQKIDRAVNSLLKSKKRVTFMAIMNKCNFNSSLAYENEYIKDKIRNAIISNK